MVVDGTTQFSDLPSCLVMDILSRLPITTLLTTCRCVCKDWNRLLGEPYFIKLQVTALPFHIVNQHIEDGILKFGQFMEDNGNDLDLKILKLPTKVNLRPCSILYDYWCINSCNGLLCFVDDGYTYSGKSLARTVCVGNPILGEWVSISTPERSYSYLSLRIPLVFSAKNNQYKLLHCFHTKEEGYGYEIYTLGGTRQWRSVHETLGCRPEYIHDSNTLLLHGALHWTNNPWKQDFICCFDVDNEKFRRLSLPSLRRQGKSSNVKLGVIKGCLCAIFNCGNSYQTDPMEIWAMKEYGVEKSWVMMHTVHVSGLPLFSLNEEEFLMHAWNKEEFISYNLKTKRCRRGRLPYPKKTYYFDVSYKPSFISLQDVARGEEEVILSRTVQIIQ